MISTIIIGIIILLIIIYVITVYNRFIRLKHGIEANYKQIKVALKKRLDLISQVVESVKGEMKFEKETLTEITRMRSEAGKETSPEQTKELENKSRNILAGLKVQVENYPNLKANENVKQLINSINELEEEISRLRYVYNNTIQEFNTKSEVFPSNIIAGLFGFNKQKYLSFEEEEKLEEAPKIKL